MRKFPIKTMDHSFIRIQLESDLSNEIWRDIEGDIISNLLKLSKAEKSNNAYKSLLEGHSFKVTQDLTPKLFGIFREVCDRLEFSDPVDFYITNSPEVNAFSSARTEDDQPHIVNINSTLVDKFDDEELQFVIGHEIGHIISNNTRINEIVNFVFTDPSKLPILLYNKLTIWNKLAELTADRYGLIACRNLEKCISGFFKLSSGLDISKTNFDYNSFLRENDRRLEFFRKEKAGNFSTHPVNPLRIKAIECFFKSDLFKRLTNKKEPKKDKDLDKQISELTDLLLILRSSELDYHRSMYVASAGLIMASIDEKVDASEYEAILNTLASFLVFPVNMLKQIMKKGNQKELFLTSAQKLLQQNPIERDDLFDYLIAIALTDKKILEKEIVFLNEAGQNLFQFSPKEIAQKISFRIQQSFIPKIIPEK
jgi:Peptidase family M48/Tellurite resistance protein TerB